MADKNTVSDWSSTPNSNDNVAGIVLGEGMAPSGVNDAIRTIMAQIKSDVNILALAQTVTARDILVTGATGNSSIANAAFGLGEIEIRGNGTGGAFVAFHRPSGQYLYFGIDTDGFFKVGGGTAGAAAKKVILGGKARFQGSFASVSAGNDAGITTVENLSFTADSLGVGGGTRLFIPETGLYVFDYSGLNTAVPSTPVILAHTLNGSVGASRAYAAASLEAAAAPGLRYALLSGGDYITLRCVAGQTHTDPAFNRFTIMQVE